MKKFKRFLVMFCITSLMLTTVAFAKTDYNYDENQVKEYVESYIDDILGMDATTLEYYVNNTVGWTKEACETMLNYVQNDTLGELKTIDDSALKEDGQMIIATVIAHYEKADLKTVTTLTNITDTVTVVDIDFEVIDTSDKSLGERMATAAFNTVIGIVSVFLVLILISFIISLFKYIPKIQEMFERRKSDSAEEALESAIAQIEQKEELADNTELVAVITAAICAATGTSSDSFVVRSIKKADRKKKNI